MVKKHKWTQQLTGGSPQRASGGPTRISEATTLRVMDGSPNLRMEITLPGRKRFIMTTGKSDLAEASRIALAKEMELRAIPADQPIPDVKSHRRTVGDAIDHVIASLDQQGRFLTNPENKLILTNILKRLREYWGEKLLASINDIEIEKWRQWRLQPTTRLIRYVNKRSGRTVEQDRPMKRPTQATVGRELTELKACFEVAYRNGWITRRIELEPLRWPGMVTDSQRRQPIPEDHIAIIQDKIAERREPWWNGQRHSGQLLCCWIETLMYGGMRPHNETRGITFRMIEPYEDMWLIRFPRVTDKPALALPEFGQTLQHLQALFLSSQQRAPKPDDAIFTGRSGKETLSFTTHWRRLMAECGLPAYVPYQLRHSYATRMNRLGVDRAALAENMRTSERMLREVYVEATIDDRYMAFKRKILINTTKEN